MLAGPMRIPRVTSLVLLIAFILSSVWLALVVLSPYMVPSGTLTDLSGRVGGHENEDQFRDLGTVPHAIYWAGDAECHQILNRSYTLNGNQMPFCARDLGLFMGIALGFGLASFYRWKIPALFVILGLLPIALDGGIQAVTSYESNNPMRLATGLVAGLVLSLLLAHFVFVGQEDRAGSADKQPSSK